MHVALARADVPDAAAFAPHGLHAADRIWPETNCYVDLWIELLHARGLVPEAMLGFTLRQDFEGDQFTFFKPFAADLDRLYGLEIQELAIFESLEAHALVQAARGNPMLVEVDAIHLPDTAGTTYGREHGKTTIGILGLDLAAKALDYLHNAGRFRLSGADYEGIFGPSALFPYAEFVKATGTPLARDTLPEAALDLLRRHRARAPRTNPVRAFREALAARAPALVQNPLGVFHSYAFNTTRQLGANFELLGSHLAWLAGEGMGDFAESETAATELASEAKAFQFQLARAFGRRNPTGLCERLDRPADTYERVFAALDRALA
ncbi:DUF1839 family protein [Methylobacterium brachythecii]|uniref:DUF1839 family protein n=1 Tax=Methylobacterium brachythecii TaxID=1176177 RepID=A0A7W6AFV2_9HYPH|nr:DUF1839 family protein [Methylobacterium brachythecii]MBB3901526.1 hypothetical protein [Methylobacterium brachythecii]GLS43096.1 hypothetical protein GCM10007884_10810 [Methylobacterium brachythecii]